MDRQLREAEASIASLTSTVKTLEDQVRLTDLLRLYALTLLAFCGIRNKTGCKKVM